MGNGAALAPVPALILDSTRRAPMPIGGCSSGAQQRAPFCIPLPPALPCPGMPVFRRAAAPLLLLIITICFYWKLTGTTQYSWLDSSDLANQVLPWWSEQARQWHAGSFPAWDPHLWGGQPLLGQAQPGAAYPLNWLLFLTKLKDGQLRPFYLNGYFVLIHFIAALNCFLLCRYLKRSRTASILAGCLFAFGGFVGNTDWPQMLNGAIWAPLVFLFLLRANAGVQPLFSAACSGCFLGLCWLSGHHQVPIFLTYAAGATWLYFLFREKRLNWTSAKLAAIFLLFFIASAGPQIFPALEYGKNAKRWVGSELDPIDWATPVPYYVHRTYSFGPASLLGIVFPGLHRQTSPLLGVTGLTAALLGLALCWRGHFAIRLFTAIGLLGVLMALGNNSFLHGVLYSWAPMFEKARSPHMAIVLFGFAASILAAFGFDAATGAESAGRELWTRRAIRINTIFGVLLFIAFTAWGLFRGIDAGPDDRPLIPAMMALLIAAALLGFRNGSISRPVLGAAMILFALTELGNEAALAMPHQAEPKRQSQLAPLSAHNDIAQFLKQEPQPVRIIVDDQLIPYNFGDWHGIDQMFGYLAGITSNLTRLDLNTPHARQLFAVTHSVGKAPVEPDWELAFQGSSGVNVYRNPHPNPRVWTVHKILPLDKEGDAKHVLNHPDMDVSTLAFVIGKPVFVPPGGVCGVDSSTIQAYEPSRVLVEADLGCGGLLVLADTYFPGWQATVDGKPQPVLEVYGAVRGVVLGAGKHRVEFTYLSAPIRFGATGLLGSCLGLLFLFIFDRKESSLTNLDIRTQ